LFLFTSLEWDSPFLCTCVEKLRLGGNAATILKVKVKAKQSLYIPDSRRLRLLDYKTIGT